MTRRSLYLWAIIAVAASGAVLRVLATDSWKYVFLALWGLAMVCGVLFMFWILLFDRFLIPVRDGMREAERESRLRRGRCGTCGYDLRASPDACPECGTRRAP